MRTETKIGLMAHLVAGFPTLEASTAIARALKEGGADILEVQFPFSDPSADGIPIQQACGEALAKGIRVNDGFNLVKQIREQSGIPVFIMSYANLIVSMGVEEFVDRAADSGAAGIIAPDLMPGSDESLYEIGRARGVEIVPVITPRISPERLRVIMDNNPRFLYCALRSGITGSSTTLDGETITFLEGLRGTEFKVIAGFGIDSYRQIEALSPHVDVAIAGSVFVREILKHKNTGTEELYRVVKRRVELLLRG